jgi:hypothetical protein
MMKTPLRIALSEDFQISKYSVPVAETRTEKVWKYFMYGVVAAGVTFAAAYVVTPADAREVGSMNHEARVIQVSPSISIYGSRKEEGKVRGQIMRDNNRHANDMELENLRSLNRRALEADRAYYKKLEFQRKKRGW